MRPDDCSELRLSWDDYRISNLSREEAENLERHLETCPDCADFVDMLSRVEAGIAQVGMDPLTRRRIAVAVSRPGASVEQRPPVARIRVWVPAVAMLAAAAAVAVVLFAGGEMTESGPRTTGGIDTTGAKTRISAASEPLPQARQWMQMQAPDGRKYVNLFEGTDIWFGDGAVADVVHLDEGSARVELRSGSIVSVVGPRVEGFRFVVGTPSGSIAVAKGTVYAVEVGENGREYVRVLEGVVEVMSAVGAPPVEVGQGRGVTIQDGSVADVKPGDLARDRELAFGSVALARAGQNNTAESASPDRRVQGVADQSQKLTVAAQEAVEAIKARRFDEAASLVDQVANKAPGSADTRNLLARLARAYRRARLFGPASNTYRRLIEEFPGSESAASGTVALAQIELDALGDPRGALRHFDDYITSAPGGVLAEVARAGKVRALSRMSRHGAVVAAVDDYLKWHPAGASVQEMSRRRKESTLAIGQNETEKGVE